MASTRRGAPGFEEVVNAVIRYCRSYCNGRAKTVRVRARDIAALLRVYYSIVGSLLHYIMQHLTEHGLARICSFKHNCRYVYVIECRNLDKIEKKLRELEQTS